MASSADDTTHIEKLIDHESYKLWKVCTTVLFKANALYEIVNGSKKLNDLTKDEEKADWIRKDARAQKIIITSVDRKFLFHVINCKTSSEMYTKLCELFERGAEEEVNNELQEYYNFKFENDMDMATFIMKIENMAFKLNVLDQNISDKMIMNKIIASLPKNYSYFKSAWDSTPRDEKTKSNLIARLLAEESRNKTGETEPNQVAFKVEEKKGKYNHNKPSCSSERKCFICDSTSHLAKSCPKNTNSKREKYCRTCKKSNHWEKDCYFRKKESKKKPEKEKVAFLTYGNDCDDKRKTFVVDSGSSSHMSHDKSLVVNFREKMTEVLVAKKSQCMKVEGVGEIEGASCVLENVLYSPDLTKNLISVNAITEKDGVVTFAKDKVVITKDGNKIMEGTKQGNGLYTVNLDYHEKEVLFTEKTDLALEWHKKLGHMSVSYMKKLVPMVNGINLCENDFNNLNPVCEVCLQAKQSRFPFSSERQRATRPLQIIHTDLVGPIEPKTWDGKRYALTFLDDFTNYTKVELLETKNEAEEYIKEYINEAEAFHNLKASKIRCDSGGEYIGNNLKSWCKSRGIILDYTVSHTPQLNGKAERLNRTLLDKTRALLFESNVSKELWGEAIRTSAYLMNRSPSQAVPKTPSEMWTGRKPDLSCLQIFGSDAHSKVLGKTKKLDPRSKKLTFVGYSLNGYRLWNSESRKLINARDVIFEERKVIPEEKTLINLNQWPEELETTEEEVEIVQDQTQQIQLDEEIEPRRRNRRPPVKFNDYVLLTFEEATTGSDKDKWLEAIEEEKTSLMENKTWELIEKDVIQNKKILSSRWVFKVKDDGRHRARLVIRGCEQIYGIDYEETFSPVISDSAIRLMFAISANLDYKMKKFDIKTAFLYGEVKEDIYMEIPEGFNENGKVCKLKKSLYGLKQAPLQWNIKFSEFLKKTGFIQLKTERCIFKTDDSSIILALYVDDGIIFSKNEDSIKMILEELKNEFKITVFENIETFVGVHVTETSNSINLTQEKFANTIVERFGMKDAKISKIPMETSKILDSKKNITFPYREAIGNLLYISNKTRPDIAFSVGLSSRRMIEPTDYDVNNVKKIIKYIKGTVNDGITFRKDGDLTTLNAYCDADFAGDEQTRRSTTGYVIYYSGAPIVWCSRRQPIVATSTTEAEFISAAECCREVLYLKSVISEVLNIDVKINLCVDNQSALALIKNNVLNRKRKHIDVKYHFICEKVNEGLINVQYCPSNENVADIFTKPLGGNIFNKFKSRLLF